MASHPPKRVRTGCLKCRARRRKCDEGKPRCRRCVAGGFECQYGTRLSFLQKNAITPQAAEATGPSAAYRRVQFVPEPVAQPPNRETAQPEPPSSPANLRIVHESPYAEPRTPVTAGSSNAPDTRWGHTASTTTIGEAARAKSPDKSLPPNSSWPGGFTHAGGYEIALDALLSLGEDKSGTPTDQGRSPGSPLGSRAGLPSAGPAVDEKYIESTPAGNTRGLGGPGALGLSQSTMLGLLRHYRYEIAPWLDICDLGHTFGISVLCLASVSEPVLHSVLDFTASLRAPAGERENHSGARGSLTAASGGCAAQFPPAVFSTRLLCQVLTESSRILTNDLGESPHRGMAKLGELFSASPVLLAARSLNVALYYLSLRLDLGESLASGQPPKLPLWHPRDFPFDGHRSESAAGVFRSSSEILVLCAHAARLVFGGPDTPAEARVEQWTSILESLGSWYTSRHQNFRPMVEIDGKGGGFPLLLFTSGAGLMANQLYHTAMLLMLQSRPRAARVSGARAATMSALWHARRICGIALANDARESWDPSLVASFVVAARGMTHADQHELLLGKLEEVGRLTGWKVGYYRSILTEEWSM